MRKKSTRTFLVILALLFFICTHAQTNMSAGSFKFHGYIGHPDIAGAGQKPQAVMVADVSAVQIKKECSFFGGDSLSGFDFDAASKASAQDGIKMYQEFKVFMFRAQLAYVKKKYNVAKLPIEIAAEKKRQVPPYVLTSPCNNLDFENGNLSGWLGGTGYNNNSNAPLTVSGTAYYATNANIFACDDLSLISSSYGQDPVGNFPGVDPNGGFYSLRLGGSYWNTNGSGGCATNDPVNFGSNGEMVSQTFLVTPGNALITFDCAIILNDGSHLAGEQPYFHIDVTDAGGTILNTCSQYYIQLASGVPPPGFILSSSATATYGSNVYYQNWQRNSLNLTPYIGQTVVLKFTAAGCIYGGHFGYAYIDASCGPAQIASTNASACTGSGSNVTLIAPTGGAYSWSGPGIIGSATNQTAVVNASGTYSVAITPSQGASCVYTLTSAVTINSLSASIGSSSNATCATSNGAATVNPSGGASAYTYLWSTGGQTTQTATGIAPGTYSVLVTDAIGCTASASVLITAANGPTVTATASYNVSCNGGHDGKGSANTTGGTPAYTYMWSNGQTNSTATGLGAGSYTVTVTDAGNCSFTTVASITQPAALSNTFSSVNVSCNGGNNGTATANPSGGTSPYTYSWNNGQTAQTATGLSFGNYTVTITDSKSCIQTATVAITQPAVLVNTVSSSVNVSCNGGSNGSATASPSGGTVPYTYLWSNGQLAQTATGLSATNYTVTVTDNKGCAQTATVAITQPTALTNTISASTAAGCTVANGTATASPSGGTPAYTYLWSPSGKTTQSATGLASGTTYTALVTDNKGCTKTSTVTIAATASPTVSVSSTPATCVAAIGSATVNPSGGTPGYTYAWSTTPVQTTATATGFSAGNYSVLVTDAMGCTGSAATTISAANGPTVTATASNNVSCSGGNDGSVMATTTGGLTPYTYLWNNAQTTSTATGLISGSYTVTVTDAGNCSFVTGASVTQPAILTVTTSPVNVSCNGGNSGSATATPGGGNSPYTYLWNNGQTTQTATGLSFGNYTITVTDYKSCVQTATVAITQPTALTNTISASTPAGCSVSNGTATANPGGGTLAYTYLWSNGQTTKTATGFSAGTCSVLVTDANGCTASASVTISSAGSPIINSISAANVSCNGGNNGMATANASGGAPAYGYAWSPSGGNAQTANGLAAGNYSVTVTDANGCSATQTVTITQPIALTTSMSVTDASSCSANDGVVTPNVSGGSPSYSYTWNNGQTVATAAGLGQGSYTLTVTDSHSCIATFTATVNCATDVEQLMQQNDFAVYPNPTSGIFTIATQEKEYEVIILDLLGEKIYSSNVNSQSAVIKLDAPAGVYFLQFKTSKGTVNKRIVLLK